MEWTNFERNACLNVWKTKATFAPDPGLNFSNEPQLRRKKIGGTVALVFHAFKHAIKACFLGWQFLTTNISPRYHPPYFLSDL